MCCALEGPSYSFVSSLVFFSRIGLPRLCSIKNHNLKGCPCFLGPCPSSQERGEEIELNFLPLCKRNGPNISNANPCKCSSFPSLYLARELD
ncbi:hypothetical protein Sjap_006986 [Stephania japonica]|uniref:Uncharacterized protein n=1 Tax=Stephania japonica TaxID=461633 RepID=A0AAP0PJH4_9MAGN